MRNTPEAAACGEYRQDGELRDLRLGLCQRHHIFWKPQQSEPYWKLIKQIIGPVRAALMERGRSRTTSVLCWGLEGD
jgi:hypothetical protein